MSPFVMDNGRRKTSSRTFFTAFCAAAHSFSTFVGDPKIDATNLLLAIRPNVLGGVTSEGLLMDGLFNDRRAASVMTRAREAVASRRRRTAEWERATESRARVADAGLVDARARRARSERFRAGVRRLDHRARTRARV